MNYSSQLQEEIMAGFEGIKWANTQMLYLLNNKTFGASFFEWRMIFPLPNLP